MPLKVTIVACAACFVLGVAGLYLIAHVASAIRRRSQKSRQHKATRPAKAEQEKPSIISRIGAALERFGTMNLILLVLGVMLFWFTVTMIGLFREYGSGPDTLVNCVFVALTGECGMMGWIKTSKIKHREREWMKEDINIVPPEEVPGGEDGPDGGAG